MEIGESSGFDPFQKWPVPEFEPLHKNDYFVTESPICKAPVIEFSWQGPDTRTDVPATYAADVFSTIISQNASSLSKALLQSGLAISVSFGYLTLNHVGPISLNVIPNPDKIKECIAAIKQQLKSIDDFSDISDAQIEVSKRKLEIKKIREQEVTSDFVHVLSFWWASASLDYFSTYNDNLQKVTKEDMKNYVRKYIKEKPYCAGLLIDPNLSEKIAAKDFFRDE